MNRGRYIITGKRGQGGAHACAERSRFVAGANAPNAVGQPLWVIFAGVVPSHSLESMQNVRAFRAYFPYLPSPPRETERCGVRAGASLTPAAVLKVDKVTK